MCLLCVWGVGMCLRVCLGTYVYVCGGMCIMPCSPTGCLTPTLKFYVNTDMHNCVYAYIIRLLLDLGDVWGCLSDALIYYGIMTKRKLGTIVEPPKKGQIGTRYSVPCTKKKGHKSVLSSETVFFLGEPFSRGSLFNAYTVNSLSIADD